MYARLHRSVEMYILTDTYSTLSLLPVSCSCMADLNNAPKLEL